MKKFPYIFLLAALIVLSACGTTETTETSAPTQAVETQPSSTSFSMEVTVTDADGNPIPWAFADVEGVGSSLTKNADASGVMSWSGLSNNSGTLTVSAQGFITAQETISLAEGVNALSVTLEGDPKQLNPATVCEPGQTVLYVEDFEDNKAQDFVGATAPMWNIKSLDDRGVVLEVDTEVSGAAAEVNAKWDNGLLHFDMLASGTVSIEFYFHSTIIDEGNQAGTYRYVVRYDSDSPFTLGYELPTEANTLISGANVPFEVDTWHSIDIAFYKGEISVYLDGTQQLTFTHAVPVAAGEFGYFVKEATSGIVQFDNIIVCSLGAAYTP